MREGLVNIVGGCCGSTPDHIAAIAALAKKYAPRTIPAPKGKTVLAGYEPVPIGRDAEGGVTIIGERTNTAGNGEFIGLIKEENYNDAIEVVREMMDHGAAMIDVCMDDAELDAKSAMTRFLNMALAEPDIARVPIMIDSSDWEVIEAGLRCMQGKALIHSISLREGEGEFLRKGRLVRRYGAAAVVLLFDEQGQAVSHERRIAIAQRSYALLTGDGFPPEDIVFDLNVPSAAMDPVEHDRCALDFNRSCEWIRQHCPGTQILGKDIILKKHEPTRP
jgi:5-methyltetrahydrofolate--homocysteine methyltransferase